MIKKIKVLVVDDSALVRSSLCEIISESNEFEVIGTASDPFIAAKKIMEEVPDIITLDVEMPRMDGITFLSKIMSQHPIPVVMCSSLTERSSEIGIKALENGAVDIITKPRMGTKQFFEESKIRILDTLKAASLVKVKRKAHIEVAPKLNADAIITRPKVFTNFSTDKIIVVGASTGGTEALKVFLEDMPSDCPGIVIVQHMPENFTASFAKRLNTLCEIEVKEAGDGDEVKRGRAIIAKGNHHLILKRREKNYFVEVKEGPLVSRHKPSVDVLFRSAARYAGKNSVGVILTGMGDDGAKGMLEMKEAGSFNIAQDEKTSVVFGMPAEAIKLNAVNSILPIDKIASTVLNQCIKKVS